MKNQKETKIENQEIIENQENQKNIIDYFNNKKESGELFKLKISQDNYEKLKNTSDFKEYSKSIFVNKANKRIYKFFWSNFFIEWILFLFWIATIFTAIDSFSNKDLLSTKGVVFIAASAFYILYSGLTQLFMFNLYNSWQVDSSTNNRSGIKKNWNCKFFVEEYLKSSFEFVNNVNISEERKKEWEKNFSASQYNIQKKGKDLENNKPSFLIKKMTKENYITKSKIFSLLITDCFWVFTGFAIISAIVSVIIVSTVL